MSLQSWQEALAVAKVAGTTLSSFTTAASTLPTAARCTLQPGFFQPGKVLRINAMGALSNVVTAQPTFTFSVNLGATGTTSVFSGGAMLTSTTAHTTVPLYLDLILTCRAEGSGTSANLMGQGCVTCQAFLVSGATADAVTNGHTTLMIPNTAPAVGSGFDSTITNVLDLMLACGTSNAANAFTLHQYTLESLN